MALAKLGAFRSLRLPFIRAGMAPDRVALIIVVVVEWFVLDFDRRRHGLRRKRELAQVHTPCPSTWGCAQAPPICCIAHQGGLATIANHYA